MTKLPAFQFYPGDWLKDTALRKCSPAARGVWMDVLCLMFESEERGYLVTNALPWALQDVTNAVSGNSAAVEEAFRELIANGVVKIDSRGCFYSKRLVADELVRKQTRKRVRKHRSGNALCNGDVTVDVTPLYEDEEEEVSLEVDSLKESTNSATKAAPHFDLEAYWQRLVKIYNKAEKSAFTQQTYVLIVDGDEAVARLIESRAALYVRAKGNFTVGLHKFLNERIFEQSPEVWSNGNGNGKASREARTRAIAEQVAFESDDSTEESVQRHH